MKNEVKKEYNAYFTVSTSPYDSNPLPLNYWKTVEAVVDDLIEQGLKAYVTVEYRPDRSDE